MRVSRLAIVILMGILGIGLLPVAHAKVQWVNIKHTGKVYCPEVCKVTERLSSEHPQFNVPYVFS